jgi:hypothetical protein
MRQPGYFDFHLVEVRTERETVRGAAGELDGHVVAATSDVEVPGVAWGADPCEQCLGLRPHHRGKHPEPLAASTPPRMT